MNSIKFFLVFLIVTTISNQSYANCPTGYHQEGKYCVASSTNAKPATSLYGSYCPTGWHQEGKFCVLNRLNPVKDNEYAYLSFKEFRPNSSSPNE